MLHDTTRCFKICMKTKDFARYDKPLQDCKGFLQDIARFFSIWTFNARSYKILQDNTRYHTIVQGITRYHLTDNFLNIFPKFFFAVSLFSLFFQSCSLLCFLFFGEGHSYLFPIFYYFGVPQDVLLLLNDTNIYSIIQEYSGCIERDHKRSQDITRYSNITRCCKILQHIATYCKIQCYKHIAPYCRILQNIARCHWRKLYCKAEVIKYN